MIRLRPALNAKAISAIACFGLALVLSVAPAGASAAECPNEQLREESVVNLATGQPYSMQLPDCRAYELVSPTNTGGMPAILGLGYSIARQFLATLDGSILWQSQATPAGTAAVPDGGYLDVFRSTRTTSGWTTADVQPHHQAGNVLLIGASTDGLSVLVETMLPLSPIDIDDPTGNTATGEDLYVVREGGTTEFVTHGEVPNMVLGEKRVAQGSILLNPALSAVGFETQDSLASAHGGEQSTAGCYVWDAVQGALAEPTDRDEAGTATPGRNCDYFAVAADGRPIVRITDGEVGDGEIVAVDPAAATDGEPLNGGSTRLGGRESTFAAISPDAQTVYLSSPEHLTPEATGEVVRNLYGIGLDGLRSTCMSCDADGAPNSASAEYVGQSGDGSHVYFTVAGAIYQHDASGVQKVAPASDDLDHFVFAQSGSYVIAETAVALAAGDTNGTNDIYELSASAAPTLITTGVGSTATRPLAVSDKGDQVLYEAFPRELPEVIDEWAEGQTSQISPVGSTYGYQALDEVGPELESVFFAAHDPLVGQDENAGTTDIYDARLDGGFPLPAQATIASQTPNPTTSSVAPFAGDLSSAQPLVATLPAGIVAPKVTKKVETISCEKKAKKLKSAKKRKAALKKCGKEKR